ncbi:hypothetical protein J2T55_000179 [Methylohalomonas lacus]|uniref:Uncharacterized protein n=1 Tax=Methylohalomonas lacus TaxID=398773 RepID=A0AAE3L4S7_9GAMM|nr:hypothetical protein [Methylohalomonas lacus]
MDSLHKTTHAQTRVSSDAFPMRSWIIWTSLGHLLMQVMVLKSDSSIRRQSAGCVNIWAAIFFKPSVNISTPIW